MALTLDAAFKPRHNSIGFLRWLMAFMVIFSHAGPLGGFYNSQNLGNQWTDQQSFGGVAVAGFFFLSGFLITKSRMGRSTVWRFFWRRTLRIFPAFWASLLLVALVLAPIAFWHVNGTIRGYVSSPVESPLTYFSNDMFLRIHQGNIDGLGAGLPLSRCCTLEWNGSAWTLIYEFKGYILIGVLGVFGILWYRSIASLAFLLMLGLNTLTFLSVNANVAILDPLTRDFFNIMLLTPFFFGMMFALWGDKIPIDDRLAAAAGAIAFFTYFIASGWMLYGQFAFLYLVMWCAVRLPLQNWERHGDLSYGIYIYAWPIQQFAAFFDVYKLGWFGYHLIVVVACHIAAYLSWHLLEKPALSLKNWTPKWLSALIVKARPYTLRAKRALVNPDYSSTHFAKILRHDAAGLSEDRRDENLVSHEVEDRLEPAHHHPGRDDDQHREPDDGSAGTPSGTPSAEPDAGTAAGVPDPGSRILEPASPSAALTPAPSTLARTTTASTTTRPPTTRPPTTRSTATRSTGRKILRRVAVLAVAMLVIVVGWVFPAVYSARYDPATKESALEAPAASTEAAGGAGATAGVATPPATDTAWHRIPSAEQDQIYTEQTQTNAAHPGLLVEGRDGYIFFGDAIQTNFAQAMGRRFYSREEVWRTVDAVKSRKQWLANRGIASEFVVVPATWSVYSDKMPAWADGQIMPHILDQLIAADPALFPDLRPDLKSWRATAETYPRLNSHWTPFGAFIGFQALVDHLKSDQPGVSGLPVPVVTGTTTRDSNNEFASITKSADPNDWVVPEFSPELTPFSVIGSDGTSVTVPGDTPLDIAQMPLRTENPAAGNDHRALILADSATSSMSPYLAAAFGSTMMVRHNMDHPDQGPNVPALVESYQPDVVITLLSERFLDVVTPDTELWQAAAAYDAAGPDALDGWTATSDGTSTTITGPPTSPSTVGSATAAADGALVVRLDLQASAAAAISVGGVASGAPFSIQLFLAAGQNTLFARIPPGLEGPSLTITRTGGEGTWSATDVTVRALL